MEKQFGELTADGNWFWNGTGWQASLSPDWRWRWDGAQWVATGAGTGAEPPPPPGWAPMPLPATRVVRNGERPTIYWVFSIYCLLAATIGTVLAFAFGASLAMGDGSPDDRPLLAALLVASLAIVGLFGVAPFLPKKRWAWIYGIVVLVVGILVLGGIFAGVILIFWVGRRNQAYYSRP